MSKRIIIPFIVVVALALAALAWFASSPNPKKGPPPALMSSADDWKVNTSKVDVSNLDKALPELTADTGSVVDQALGILARSHLEDGILYYEGWTPEDLKGRYEELVPYMSEQFQTEAEALLLTEDMQGNVGMTLPLLPRAGNDGLVVNYDMKTYHTNRQEKVAFMVPQETVSVSAVKPENRDKTMVAVEFTLVTIIPTIEKTPITFENRIIYYMDDANGHWVLDTIEWFGDPGHVYPDEFKATYTEEEIAEMRKKAEEEGRIIID